MQKLASIQALRAVAALLVVWAHAIDVAVRHSAPPLHARVGGLENFGAVGVDIFFVISGLIVSLTALRAESWWDFLRRRLLRIWPLYALATLVAALVALALDSSWDRLRLLCSLLFLQLPGQPAAFPTHPLGWSLMFELWFYLLLTLFLAALHRHLKVGMVLVLLLMTGLGELLGHPQPLNIIGNPISLEFALGLLIGAAFQSGWRAPARLGTALLATGVGLLLHSGLHGFGLISEAQYTLDTSLSWARLLRWGLPAGFLVAGVVFRVPEVRGRLGRGFVFLGDASYSLYLTSFLTLLLLRDAWPVLWTFSPDLGVLVLVALATLAGIAAHLGIERPLARLLHGHPVPRPRARPTPTSGR